MKINRCTWQLIRELALCVPWALITMLLDDKQRYLSWPMRVVGAVLGVSLFGLQGGLALYVAQLLLGRYPPWWSLGALLWTFVVTWTVGVALLLIAGLIVEQKNQHRLK